MWTYDYNILHRHNSENGFSNNGSLICRSFKMKMKIIWWNLKKWESWVKESEKEYEMNTILTKHKI